MNRIKEQIPPPVLGILGRLEEQGYEAYVVGGCVRDCLLNREPQDWDVTTSATPEQVLSAFPEHAALSTGLRHGTVALVMNRQTYEVTTYRVDGKYGDLRRPDTVYFTTSLKEDLARRDFTINAMAYHPVKGLQDYYGGLKDLENKVIRCVGDPFHRFSEDGLRLFRCVRFACQLGFSIENKTGLAMLARRDNLNKIAVERLQVELNKALLGDYFQQVFTRYYEMLFTLLPELAPLLNFEQHTHYHIYDVYIHTLGVVDQVPKELSLKLAALFHDIGKPVTYAPDSKGVGHFPKHGPVGKEMTKPILKRLKYSRQISERVLYLIEYHGLRLPPQMKVIRRWLNRLGEEAFRQVLDLQLGDAMAKNPQYGRLQLKEIEQVTRLLDEALEEDLCFSLAQLAISGQDLIQLGVEEGPKVGELLNQLLGLVIEDKLKNKKEVLLSYAKNLL